MPLKQQPGAGTNADGSKSTMFCAYCYENGKFKQPDWTAAQMQEFVKQKLKEKGLPGFMAGLFSKGVPRLERWKQ